MQVIPLTSVQGCRWCRVLVGRNWTWDLPGSLQALSQSSSSSSWTSSLQWSAYSIMTNRTTALTSGSLCWEGRKGARAGPLNFCTSPHHFCGNMNCSSIWKLNTALNELDTVTVDVIILLSISLATHCYHLPSLFHCFTLSSNLPFWKILSSTLVCFCLSNWSHGSRPFTGPICSSVLRFSSISFCCFNYSW